MRQRFPAHDLPPFAVGIGLHSGEAVLGNIGSPVRMEFSYQVVSRDALVTVASGRTVHAALPQVIERHPQLLGIGIDEGTAILVRGDEFEVIGASRVFVYGGTDPQDDEGPWTVLEPGTRYDLRGRRILK